MSSPAGLGIYFFIGGVFAILQQLIVNSYRPRIIKKINEEAKKNPPKIIIPDTLNSIENDVEKEEHNQTNEQLKTQSEKNRNRNKNRQKHHKK